MYLNMISTSFLLFGSLLSLLLSLALVSLVVPLLPDGSVGLELLGAIEQGSSNGLDSSG